MDTPEVDARRQTRREQAEGVAREERQRSDRWFLRFVVVPTIAALIVGAWLGWW